MKISKTGAIILIILIGQILSNDFVFGSSTDGTIDSTYKYAWSENSGWIDFGTAQGNVHITDSALTGYAWGENIGWISLNCSNTNSCGVVDFKVQNDGEGSLSGYAWSENAGWIDFNPANGGVTIDNQGDFSGYAWGENIGWIVFNCATTNSCGAVDYKVKTDWRPQSARVTGETTTSYPIRGGTSSFVQQEEQKEEKKTIIGNLRAQLNELLAKTFNLAKEIADLPGEVVEFFKPQPEEPEPPIIAPPIEEAVKEEAPLSMRGEWDLISDELIDNFVFAPLPQDIQELTDKLPQLKETFDRLGINNLKDIEKLRGTEITLPSLIETLMALKETELSPKEISSLARIPVSELPLELKEVIPQNIVFLSLLENIPLNPVFNLSKRGEIEEKISVFPSKPLVLTIKPENPVKEIQGYIEFRSPHPLSEKNNKTGLARIISSITASLSSIFKEKEPSKETFIINQFQYQDPDNDGIYTAKILTPSVIGIYQIVSYLDYIDDSLDNKELKTTLLIDPEGYVYYKTKTGDELRIKEAKVSIYWLNPETNDYQLWPASDYQQVNPQITDNTGRYSFLVPKGRYYLRVEANNFIPYQSEIFEIKQDNAVHQNIELKSKYWWVGFLDWNIILLAVIAVLLAVIAVSLIALIILLLRKNENRDSG